MIVGYCCNVHSGTSLGEVKANLEQHSLAVKSKISPDAPLPIGLWLSKATLTDVSREPALVLGFRDWLRERGLISFTFNGFPYGDFHQDVVKKDVYLPTWAEESRLRYTRTLAQIQRVLTRDWGDDFQFQTISTLPLGWPTGNAGGFENQDPDFLGQCAGGLKQLASELHQFKEHDGVQTMVCIEPEPGCVLDTADDISRFFDQYLFDGTDKENDIIRQHIGVCHDICHSAVMFEDQEFAVKTYESVGAAIGKVQVSSAVKVAFAGNQSDSDQSKLEKLKTFSEPRYLHQTKVSIDGGQEFRFFEDLSEAIDDFDSTRPSEWRVHFHVPLFLDSIGPLETTQGDVVELMKALALRSHPVRHFEIETYAWNVLPDRESIGGSSLATGIAKEIQWYRDLLQG